MTPKPPKTGSACSGERGEDRLEHLPRDWPVFEELVRVLAPGGRMVLGTPDYGRRWRLLEWAYARVVRAARS